MTVTTLLIGDVRDVLPTLPAGSVDCVITSPPYYRQRSYLPADSPDKAREIGQEDTPGAYLETLLCLMDQLWPVLSDTGTFWVNLGDKHAGSGGAGGDYDTDGLRAGQPKWGRVTGGEDGWPLEQSVCWLPHLFGASLAYGHNLLTGQEHQQWVTRPAVTWCKPNPSVGMLTRTFRTATELIVYGGKRQDHYFDLDAVREDPISDEQWVTTKTDEEHAALQGRRQRSPEVAAHRGKTARKTVRAVNEKGVPPKNWWVQATEPYAGAHYAVFPPSLIVRPVIAGCPMGGTILDPFGGSGTTAVVATGHARNCTLIDLDGRSADLVMERVGGLYLTVEDRRPAKDGAA